MDALKEIVFGMGGVLNPFGTRREYVRRTNNSFVRDADRIALCWVTTGTHLRKVTQRTLKQRNGELEYHR